MLEFKVMSSNGHSIYRVTFDGEGENLKAYCTCPAGKKGGMFCKHVSSLLNGNVSNLIEPSDKIEDLKKISEYSNLLEKSKTYIPYAERRPQQEPEVTSGLPLSDEQIIMSLPKEEKELLLYCIKNYITVNNFRFRINSIVSVAKLIELNLFREVKETPNTAVKLYTVDEMKEMLKSNNIPVPTSRRRDVIEPLAVEHLGDLLMSKLSDKTTANLYEFNPLFEPLVNSLYKKLKKNYTGSDLTNTGDGISRWSNILSGDKVDNYNYIEKNEFSKKMLDNTMEIFDKFKIKLEDRQKLLFECGLPKKHFVKFGEVPVNHPQKVLMNILRKYEDFGISIDTVMKDKIKNEFYELVNEKHPGYPNTDKSILPVNNYNDKDKTRLKIEDFLHENMEFFIDLYTQKFLK
jgi:hypothetical protein